MSEKIPVEQIDSAPAEIAELDLYQKREKIYTRKIEGFFQKVRLYTGWPLLLGYFLLPWFNFEGRQAVWFDLPTRQFHIVGWTFWPQDFYMLAWLLMIAAFALFTVTVFAGRVWCGYTCPQTVWTAIFMWAEQFTEGSRNQRIKLDKAPMSAEKILRKTAKHTLWVGIAFFTGLTFVGYFSPIRELSINVLSLDIGLWEFAWINFFTWATYINAGWLREQVCKFMCPYARFQSVMFDRDTLIVSYDPRRGEPRGARKRAADPKSQGLGDCIDCNMCVQVCPTGIDIRKGLQYECITCALCIDACDSVMDKMGYDKGLISYTTENALEGKPSHILRGRLIGYCVVMLVLVGTFMYALSSRIPLELDIIRDRNMLYRETDMGMVENVYTLRILNMDQKAHTYRLSVEGIPSLKLIGQSEVQLGSSEVRNLPIALELDPAELRTPSAEIHFHLEAVDDPSIMTIQESRFIGPR